MKYLLIGENHTKEWYDKLYQMLLESGKIDAVGLEMAVDNLDHCFDYVAGSITLNKFKELTGLYCKDEKKEHEYKRDRSFEIAKSMKIPILPFRTCEEKEKPLSHNRRMLISEKISLKVGLELFEWDLKNSEKPSGTSFLYFCGKIKDRLFEKYGSECFLNKQTYKIGTDGITYWVNESDFWFERRNQVFEITNDLIHKKLWEYGKRLADLAEKIKRTEELIDEGMGINLLKIGKILKTMHGTDDTTILVPIGGLHYDNLELFLTRHKQVVVDPTEYLPI